MLVRNCFRFDLPKKLIFLGYYSCLNLFVFLGRLKISPFYVLSIES